MLETAHQVVATNMETVLLPASHANTLMTTIIQATTNIIMALQHTNTTSTVTLMQEIVSQDVALLMDHVPTHHLHVITNTLIIILTVIIISLGILIQTIILHHIITIITIKSFTISSYNWLHLITSII